MDVDRKELYDSLEFLNWRCVQHFVKIPWRFKSADIELQFAQWHAKQGNRFVTFAIACYSLGSVSRAVFMWRDFTSFELALSVESWNVTLWSVSVILATALCLLRLVRPTVFTERCRLAVAIYVIVENFVTNKAVLTAYFGMAWEYPGREPYPQILWSAMVLMIMISIMCNTAFSRCSTSWVVYPTSLIISVGFSFPLLVDGHTEFASWLAMQLIMLAHAHFVFLAQASAELAERLTFVYLVESHATITKERVLRCAAERRAEEVVLEPPRPREADEASVPTTLSGNISSVAFHSLYTTVNAADASVCLEAIQDVGNEEHWLIDPGDLQILPACVLGTGGFGSVVTGVWKQAQVAVKVPTECCYMEKSSVAPELRILRKLRHPNIVHFLGACIVPDRGVCLIVEELVIGETLSRMFTRMGAFAIENCQLRQRVLLDISAALQYLHGQKPSITHGDLKPGNVMVEYKTCKMKLTDFGLSRRENTRDLANGGTPNWQEPDLRSGSSAVYTGTDIWALGAMTFFLCSGLKPVQGSCISGSASLEHFGRMVQHLWAGPTAPELLKESHDGQVVLPDPEDLEACISLCISCMNPNRFQRPTAQSVHEQLLNGKQSQWRSRPSVSTTTDHGRTLLADLAEVREHAQALRSSQSKHVTRASTDIFDPIYEALLAMARSLRAVPSWGSCIDVVQIMQLLLEMVSWRIQNSECL